jgi:Ca2+-binding RTX toxin-like protein
VASETDLAGNTGTASLTFTLDTTPPAIAFTGETLTNSGKVTLTGMVADATDGISTIFIYDAGTLLGTTTPANGTWTFTSAKISNVVHTYTATVTDIAGDRGQGNNEAILGSSKADILTGTSGNDIIIGDGGNDKIAGGGGADVLTGGSGNVTFIYNAISDSTPSAADTINDFRHASDKIDLTNIAGIIAQGGVPLFQGNISGSGNLTLNAHSVAYLEVGNTTQVLINTSNATETVSTSNTHGADMDIGLVGIHLGLTATDFHHV